MGLVRVCRHCRGDELMRFNFGWGSMACVFGVDVFGKHSDVWWHKWTIWPIYRAGRSIRDGIWWVRYRIDPRHKYHLIDTRLKPGYHDIDGLMLNGMFSLLRRYVEEENEGVEELEKWGRELIEMAEKDEFLRGAHDRQGQKELEAVALYRWWMGERPADLQRKDDLMHLLYGRANRVTWTDAGEIDGEPVHEMHLRPDEGEEIEWRKELDALEGKIEREEQEMLHRLIDIRGGLWT